jgi:4-amino-4-deoxy-L-arabinose transferase-like glycosyltransferase
MNPIPPRHEQPVPCLPLGDWSAWRSAALVVPCAFLLAVVVQVVVLQRFPNSGDEYAYLWQATAFAHGEVSAETPQPQDAFRLNHVGDRNGRRFGKYPPGWPLLLAAGVAAGAPSLVNPLLAALALAGVYRLACSFVGPRAALLGTIFTGSTPFFLLNAASYFSHPACLFSLTVLALALCWTIERRGPLPLIVAGAGFGLAVLVRPYTALLVGVPLLLGLGKDVFFTPGPRRRPFATSLLWFIAGGVPFALLLAMVDRAVTGSWLTLAWTYFDPEETIGFGVHGHTLARGMRITARLCGEGVLYTSLFSPVLLVAALGRLTNRRWLLWTLLAVPIIGHVFWWSHGGNRYGPRFYFEALLPFTMLAGVGLERLLAMRRARVPLLAAAVVASIAFVVLCAGFRTEIYQRRDVYRTVDGAGLQNALVLLTTASGDMSRTDLTRNPPDWRGANVLYALSRGTLDIELLRHYPARAAYYSGSTPEGGRLWPAGTR